MGLITINHHNIQAPDCENVQAVDNDHVDNDHVNNAHIHHGIDHDHPTQKEDLFETYPEVFKGRGCMPGVVHLRVDDKAEPVIYNATKENSLNCPTKT